MEINESTIKETCKCSFDFECLKNEYHFCLRSNVENLIINSILFVKCIQNDCLYKLNYGNGAVCNCPVRKEIHIKYEK
jgi:hypothetical protein